MRKILLLMLFGSSLLLNSHPLLAQGKNISGTVTGSENNAPLRDVTVTVKGTRIATKTSQEGNYTINANKGQVLVFTFVDYVRQEQTVGDNDKINIRLAQSQTQLAEVVVTGAYNIKKPKNSLSYSTQSLEGAEVAETQRDNWMNSITGKIAGATVNSTGGAPGASSQIVLRGFNSIGGDNSALIILDGVPLNNKQVRSCQDDERPKSFWLYDGRNRHCRLYDKRFEQELSGSHQACFANNWYGARC